MTHYSDVPKDSPYYEAISFVTNQGIMFGYTSGEFVLNHMVTWADSFVILYNFFNDSYGPLFSQSEYDKSFSWFLEQNPDHKWVQPYVYFFYRKISISENRWTGHLNEPVSFSWFIEMIKSLDADYKSLSTNFPKNYQNLNPSTRANIAYIIYRAAQLKTKTAVSQITEFLKTQSYDQALQTIIGYKLFIPCFPSDFQLISSLMVRSIQDNPKSIVEIQLKYVHQILLCKYKLRLSQSPHKSLYHYTSLATLESLSSGSKFRAYHADYLNDPNEGKLLNTLLHKYMLDKKYPKWSPLGRYSTGIFVASFINDETNSLPMWSQYGNHYAGCRLELSTDSFPEGYDLYEVIYNEELITPHLDSIFNVLDEYTSVLSTTTIEISYRDDIVFQFAQDVLRFMSYLYKNPAFQHEHEVRVLIFSNFETALCEKSDQGLRDGESFPRIYTEIDLLRFHHYIPASPIRLKHILLGPKVFKPNWIKISLMQRGYSEDCIQENELELQ